MTVQCLAWPARLGFIEPDPSMAARGSVNTCTEELSAGSREKGNQPLKSQFLCLTPPHCTDRSRTGGNRQAERTCTVACLWMLTTRLQHISFNFNLLVMRHSTARVVGTTATSQRKETARKTQPGERDHRGCCVAAGMRHGDHRVQPPSSTP